MVEHGRTSPVLGSRSTGSATAPTARSGAASCWWPTSRLRAGRAPRGRCRCPVVWPPSGSPGGWPRSGRRGRAGRRRAASRGSTRPTRRRGPRSRRPGDDAGDDQHRPPLRRGRRAPRWPSAAVSYEAQAAIELEAMARTVDRGDAPTFDDAVTVTDAGGPAVLDPTPLVARIVAERDRGPADAAAGRRVPRGPRPGRGRPGRPPCPRPRPRHGRADGRRLPERAASPRWWRRALAADGLEVLVHERRAAERRRDQRRPGRHRRPRVLTRPRRTDYVCGSENGELRARFLPALPPRPSCRKGKPCRSSDLPSSSLVLDASRRRRPRAAAHHRRHAVRIASARRGGAAPRAASRPASTGCAVAPVTPEQQMAIACAAGPDVLISPSHRRASLGLSPSRPGRAAPCVDGRTLEPGCARPGRTVVVPRYVTGDRIRPSRAHAFDLARPRGDGHIEPAHDHCTPACATAVRCRPAPRRPV